MNPLLFFPLLTLLIYRALRGRGLTTLGIVAAIITALVHGYHAWSLPFILLITFYVLGTAATKVKHDVKSRLTISSTGARGGEGARTAVQVFANSLVASVLTGLAAAVNGRRCYDGEVLMVGIIANYAAVTADTLSSELGILSRRGPRLITTLRPCPPGTNGGVSGTGLLAGMTGAAVIAVVSVLLLPFCGWTLAEKARFVGFITAVGTAGSVLDSLLGAVLQESVVDVRSGKVVEAPGGGKVLVQPGERRLSVGSRPVGVVGKSDDDATHTPSRKVVAGWGVLSNNGVNFVMALLTSLGAMAVAGYWWHGDALKGWKEVVGACGGDGFCAA